MIAVTTLKDIEDGPTFATLRAKLKEAEPEVAAQPGVPDYLMVMGYYNVSILKEGLERAGRDLTREKFMAALESLSNFDTGALAGLVTFSKQSHDGLRTLGIINRLEGKALKRKFLGVIDLR